MSLQEAGDGLESIVEFQGQIKGHNQREYEDKWSWTDGKPATKLMKDYQQQVMLLPAGSNIKQYCYWPGTLPESESQGWWQRPQTPVKCMYYRWLCRES